MSTTLFNRIPINIKSNIMRSFAIRNIDFSKITDSDYLYLTYDELKDNLEKFKNHRTYLLLVKEKNTNLYRAINIGFEFAQYVYGAVEYIIIFDLEELQHKYPLPIERQSKFRVENKKRNSLSNIETHREFLFNKRTPTQNLVFLIRKLGIVQLLNKYYFSLFILSGKHFRDYDRCFQNSKDKKDVINTHTTCAVWLKDFEFFENFDNEVIEKLESEKLSFYSFIDRFTRLSSYGFSQELFDYLYKNDTFVDMNEIKSKFNEFFKPVKRTGRKIF